MYAPRIICLVVGYLLGCILSADIVARRMCGKSAFSIGSKNPGMANIGSELGTKAGAYTLAGDIVKTIAAVVICHLLYPELGRVAVAWAGLGVTLGHCFPFWHRFRGGKGVATTCSAVILISPLWGIVASLLGAGTVIASKQLCTGALVIPLAFAIFAGLFLGPEVFAVACVLFVLAVVEHGGPFVRACQGKEPEHDVLASLRARKK